MVIKKKPHKTHSTKRLVGSKPPGWKRGASGIKQKISSNTKGIAPERVSSFQQTSAPSLSLKLPALQCPAHWYIFVPEEGGCLLFMPGSSVAAESTL